MDIFTSLALIALAALVHASFQLSVSVVTLLSSHALGTKTRQMKLVRLTNSFVLGASAMSVLLLADVSFLLARLFPTQTPDLLWAIVCGLLFGVGIATWAFYYRPGRGTVLWIPRGMARFLAARSKKVSSSPEAFSLGLSSTLAEILFIAVPIFVAGLLIIRLPGVWQLAGVGLYAVVSTTILFAVTALIGSGHRLSEIQRWRETNKRFLQFAGGAGFLVLGFFLYVNQLLADHVSALVGGLH